MKPTKAQRRDITAGFVFKSRVRRQYSYCVYRPDGVPLAYFKSRGKAEEHAEFLGRGCDVKEVR